MHFLEGWVVQSCMVRDSGLEIEHGIELWSSSEGNAVVEFTRELHCWVLGLEVWGRVHQIWVQRVYRADKKVNSKSVRG